MTVSEFGFLLISILTTVVGQFLLKAGALKLGQVNSSNVASHAWRIFITPELLAGLACYGLGSLVYILLLTRVDLSVAAPAVALVYVFSVLLGYFVFKESISLTRLVGLTLIIAGVILIVAD